MNNIIEQLKEINIVPVFIGKTKDDKFEIAYLKLTYSKSLDNSNYAIEENNNESIVSSMRDDSNSTGSLMSLGIVTTNINEETIILDSIEVENTNILNLIFNNILNKIFSNKNIESIDVELHKQKITTAIFKLSQKINEQTRFGYSTFIMTNEKIISLLVNNNIILRKNHSKIFNHDIIINNNLENKIILGRSKQDKNINDSIVLCIDEDNFIIYENEQTIIKYGLDAISEDSSNYYKIINIIDNE